MTFRQDFKDTSRGLGLAAWIAIWSLIIVLVVFVIGTFGFGWFQQKSANFRGETQKRNQVEGNGAYRIAAYDHFFDLCTSVQSFEATINALNDEYKDPATTAERKEQIRGALTANKAGRNTTIVQYNNDANRSYTTGQFKDSHLPYQLDSTVKETSCTA
jgi:hypothetical protein